MVVAKALRRRGTMSEQIASDLDKFKTTYTAQGMIVLGAIISLIGIIMLFSVAKDEYTEKLTHPIDEVTGPLYFD